LYLAGADFRIFDLNNTDVSEMASSNRAVKQVIVFFKRLKMSKYTQRFLNEGFDTLVTLLDAWELMPSYFKVEMLAWVGAFVAMTIHSFLRMRCWLGQFVSA